MIDYPVRLSTTEPNNPVGVLKIRQDDKGTQKIVARITTNSIPQDLTGLEVAFNMRTSEGNVVIEKAEVKDAKLGIIEYVVSGFATQKAGRNNAYFSFFIEDYEQFSTKDFSYFVTNSVTSEGIRGCDYIWRFEDLLEFVTDLANQSQIKLNKLTSDVEIMQKQINEMFALIASQGVLTADEVRKMMVNFASGEDIEVTLNSDFTGKISNSMLENKNDFRYGLSTATSVQLPTAVWGAGEQVHIDGIKKLDGVSANLSRIGAGVIGQWLTKYDALWILEQHFPFIFKNATTTAEKVTIAKSKITKFQYNVWAKASGPTNTLCSHSLYNPSSNSWGASTTSSGTSITQRIITSNNASTPAYLTNDGFYYFVTYAEASNGTIASSVSTDYTNMSLTLKFNISDFVATKAQHEALKSSYTALKLVVDDHVADIVKHVTAAERIKWNGKQDVPVDSGWITAVTAGVTPDGAKPLQYRRIGNKMYFRGGGTFPTAAGTTFLVIPIAYAPAGQPAYHDTIVRDSDSTRKCIIQVQSDGACRIVTNSYSGNPVFLDGFEYLIA